MGKPSASCEQQGEGEGTQRHSVLANGTQWCQTNAPNSAQRHSVLANGTQWCPTAPNSAQGHPMAPNNTKWNPTLFNSTQRCSTPPNVTQQHPAPPNGPQHRPTAPYGSYLCIELEGPLAGTTGVDGELGWAVHDAASGLQARPKGLHLWRGGLGGCNGVLACPAPTGEA